MNPSITGTLRRVPSLAAGGLLVLGLMAGAVDAATPELTGSLRAGLWTGTRDLDGDGPILTPGLWLKAVAKLDSGDTFTGEGWVQGKSDFSSLATRADVTELYWKRRTAAWDFSAGRQTLVWGRADAVNPTDSIGRRDYRLLTPDDTDQRSGSFALGARYRLDEERSVQALYVPEFRGDRIPLRSAPGQRVTSIDPPYRNQLGLKYERTSERIDYSLSYFDGYDRLPDLAIRSVGAAGLELSLSHHPVRVLGADLSFSRGGTVFKGELAWSRRHDDGGYDGFFRKRSQWTLVFGGERNLPDSTNLNLQWLVQWIPDFRDPASAPDALSRAVAATQSAINNQDRRVNHGVSFRLGRSWRNDTWSGEVAGLYSLSNGGSRLRAQLKHSLDDHWRLSFGLDLYNGQDTTVFGQLERNSTAYLELRRVF